MTLEQELFNAEARLEISNLMSKYTYYFTAQMPIQITEELLYHGDSVRSEMVWGVYEGWEGIINLFPYFHGGLGRGILIIHNMAAPVIEIAGDGKTARGAWISPGHESGAMGPEEPHCGWGWCKYGADFIYEDGRWWIWHLKVYGVFMSGWDKSWSTFNKDMLAHQEEHGADSEGDEESHGMRFEENDPRAPTHPSSNPAWSYAVNNLPVQEPPLPQPFFNFEADVGYGY